MTWQFSTNLCCCCWAVWDRRCRWTARGGRRPALAHTHLFWPPRMSSSQSTWGRWWWIEPPQTLDSHRWKSHRWASPSPSSWTVSSGRGRLHPAMKRPQKNRIINKPDNVFAFQVSIKSFWTSLGFPYRVFVVSCFVALVINMVVLLLQIELDPVVEAHDLLALLGFSHKYVFKSTGILPVM